MMIDDIREDAATLMGQNNQAPIDVDGDDEEGGEPVTTQKLQLLQLLLLLNLYPTWTVTL
jgi:hypothetical protein